jgi:hypothetical protein
VAARDPAQGAHSAAQRAVALDHGHRVLRAARVEAARGSEPGIAPSDSRGSARSRRRAAARAAAPDPGARLPGAGRHVALAMRTRSHDPNSRDRLRNHSRARRDRLRARRSDLASDGDAEAGGTAVLRSTSNTMKYRVVRRSPNPEAARNHSTHSPTRHSAGVNRRRRRIATSSSRPA